MALSGKRVAKVKIKYDGDAFHQLWQKNQLQVPSLTATTFQNSEIQGNEAGTVGCVVLWSYILDGKNSVAKTQVIDIDEEKKAVTYTLLDGDLAELYKTLVVNILVEPDGSDTLVTWTAEYEKLSPEVPDPDDLMDFYVAATKEIESHHLQNE